LTILRVTAIDFSLLLDSNFSNQLFFGDSRESEDAMIRSIASFIGRNAVWLILAASCLGLTCVVVGVTGLQRQGHPALPLPS
jgi:hypothetical protein